MLFVVLYGKEIAVTERAWALWSSHHAVRYEIAALVPVLRSRNAILAQPHELDPTIPLRLHASYLGPEISAAFGERTERGHLRDYYTGVERAAGRRSPLRRAARHVERGAVEGGTPEAPRLPAQRAAIPLAVAGPDDARLPRGEAPPRPWERAGRPLLFVRMHDEDRPGVTAAFQHLGAVAPDGAEGERPISIE